jgi:Bacterial protein of unknown function (DUF899)
MTLARPPVVSQTEWDAALTAMTEREQAVAAAMHELAAARKRMPMVRVERDYRFEGGFRVIWAGDKNWNAVTREVAILQELLEWAGLESNQRPWDQKS